jgi:hypothetical protein
MDRSATSKKKKKDKSMSKQKERKKTVTKETVVNRIEHHHFDIRKLYI